MATVTMDIAELDKMRKSVEDSKQEVKDKQEEIKKLEKNLYEVENDKRIVKITTMPSFLELVFNCPTHDSRLAHELEAAISSIRINKPSPNGLGYEFHMTNFHNSRHRTVRVACPQQETRELLNFDDVKQELRQNAEKEVSDEITSLRGEAKKTDEKIADITYHFREKQKDTEKSYIKTITSQDKEISALKESLDDAIAGRKRQDEIDELNKKVTELEIALMKEKKKTWYQKII